MLKRTMVAAVLGISLSGASWAAGYGSAGCGLGSVLMGSKSGINQIFASTTNATSGNQTFGISTGTLNCDKDGLINTDKTKEIFSQQNYNNLIREMAMGQGENLDTLASLYGCPAADYARFGAFTQSHFSALVGSEKTRPEQMLKRLDSQLRQDQALASRCQKVIG